MTVFLVQYRGTMSSGGEQFQHSLAVDAAGVGTTTSANITEIAEQSLDSAYANSGLATYLASETVYTGVSAAEVLDLSTGRLAAAHNRVFTVAKPSHGGSPLPPQCAVAISLVAGTYENGTPLRGRFFMPGPGLEALSGSDGRLTTFAQDEYLSFAQNLVSHWVQPTQNVAPVVWSRGPAAGSQNPRGMSATNVIETVSVGRVVDTIRSRRSALQESYATAEVAAV
jgi:hypothetical protein